MPVTIQFFWFLYFLPFQHIIPSQPDHPETQKRSQLFKGCAKGFVHSSLSLSFFYPPFFSLKKKTTLPCILFCRSVNHRDCTSHKRKCHRISLGNGSGVLAGADVFDPLRLVQPAKPSILSQKPSYCCCFFILELGGHRCDRVKKKKEKIPSIKGTPRIWNTLKHKKKRWQVQYPEKGGDRKKKGLHIRM